MKKSKQAGTDFYLAYVLYDLRLDETLPRRR